MTVLSVPTRRDEAWRYSDLDAAARVWPVAAPERIVVAPGEARTLVLLQDGAEGEIVIRDHAVEIGAGGTLAVHLLNSGGALGRVTFDVTLARQAHFELKAALIGGETQTLELITTLNHAEPEATSAQTVRAIAAGKATTNYLGQIRVARDAQKTDASQSFKAMLLGRTATANAKPELEIFADDVKCAHGASIGQLDAAALFYMASRGIDPATAKALLLEAFIAGLFDDMADEAERERFATVARAKLEALG
ncbi:MAG: SufD family Fe-S cluster assembly protein [Alphaproteobacteria bacterium]|nr:SufD family Fe-S cluster assembly protein [Alphaproteobacteria bacterium]MBU0795466.1 SufD family Fe-S cluster assembly protein [Alphaproteobacteria bacterium]MBU0875338.1 SufD family Fe-S cluster assembly protein [Alphaproteobacteria bacterium]MBU1771268.1 SufD family Fe-S cluster assembly protein [Alphaproteobacteria bacterium]